jgi:hypothetical protein
VSRPIYSQEPDAIWFRGLVHKRAQNRRNLHDQADFSAPNDDPVTASGYLLGLIVASLSGMTVGLVIGSIIFG